MCIRHKQSVLLLQHPVRGGVIRVLVRILVLVLIRAPSLNCELRGNQISSSPVAASSARGVTRVLVLILILVLVLVLALDSTAPLVPPRVTPRQQSD